MKTLEEEYFEMAAGNTKLTRPVVCAEECLALMRDFAEQRVKNLTLPQAINAVCGCKDRSTFYRDKEDNDICYDCDLPIAN